MRALPAWVAATVLALVAGSGTLTPAAADIHPEWGSTSAKDRPLRKGCHTYRYSYELHPPEGIWALETFIRGPGGKRLASDGLLGGYDPESGTRPFRLCKVTTRYGRFTIKAKLTWGDYDRTERWLEPRTLRLRRR